MNVNAPLSKLLRHGLLCLFVLWIADSILAQNQSVQGSEITYTAGPPLAINVDLGVAVAATLSVTAVFSRTGGTEQVRCDGQVSAGERVAQLNCATDPHTVPGEYHGDGVVLSGGQFGETKPLKARLPPFTIKAFEPVRVHAIFPDTDSANVTLQPDMQQSLQDGAGRVAEIIDLLTKHFPHGLKDTRENREYLRSLVDRVKIIVDFTRDRYQKAPNLEDSLPIFFEDFDLHLEEISDRLAKKHARALNEQLPTVPHLVLAQLPKASETVDVSPTDKESDFLKEIEESLHRFTQIREAFENRSESPSRKEFTWSITSKPPGAEVWYSRLSKKEVQWVGQTDMSDQRLEYAIWTFRVVWSDGCSFSQEPDPYHQSPLRMVFDRKRCAR